MTKIKIVFSLLLVAAMAFISQSAIAGKVIKDGPLKGDGMQEPKEARLDSKREKAPWIESWYIPDGGYMENGGFGPSAPIDHIDEATKGKLTQPKLSTIEGLLMTKDVPLNFPKKHQLKGAKGTWKCATFEPAGGNGRNMSSRYGLADHSNFDTWQIIVIQAPENMKAIISPAQDDHVQIWLNGEKWHNDSKWTGSPVEVDFDIEVDLVAGGNVLLYRCGESGGHDYANMHMDDATMKKVKIFPTKKAKTQDDFFAEAASALSVGPAGKLPSTWGDIKASEW
jgi:hypothetical protein